MINHVILWATRRTILSSMHIWYLHDIAPINHHIHIENRSVFVGMSPWWYFSPWLACRAVQLQRQPSWWWHNRGIAELLAELVNDEPCLLSSYCYSVYMQVTIEYLNDDIMVSISNRFTAHISKCYNRLIYCFWLSILYVLMVVLSPIDHHQQ